MENIGASDAPRSEKLSGSQRRMAGDLPGCGKSPNAYASPRQLFVVANGLARRNGRRTGRRELLRVLQEQIDARKGCGTQGRFFGSGRQLRRKSRRAARPLQLGRWRAPRWKRRCWRPVPGDVQTLQSRRCLGLWLRSPVAGGAFHVALTTASITCCRPGLAASRA